jgi:hypothetical protein
MRAFLGTNYNAVAFAVQLVRIYATYRFKDIGSVTQQAYWLIISFLLSTHSLPT